jgi:hypothetical protein
LTVLQKIEKLTMMRWSCPHCQIQLALPKKADRPKWTLARCYQCGGYALTHRKKERPLMVLDEKTSKRVQKELAQKDIILKREPQKAFETERKSSSFSEKSPDTQISKLPLSSLISQARKEKWITAGVLSSAVLTVFSGIYLTIQGNQIWRQAQSQEIPQTVITTNSTLPSDSIETRAMAPFREKTFIDSSIRPERAAQSLNSDIGKNVSPALRGLQVRILDPHTELWRGPSITFAQAGYANPDEVYIVLNWKDNWFQIAPRQYPDQTAWLPNDMVAIETQ